VSILRHSCYSSIPLPSVSDRASSSSPLRNDFQRCTKPRDFVDAGGLISYGPNLSDQFRRAATYVDKILRGAKPADLPIEQPTKFELVINMNAANALGIKFPDSILIRADEVIQ
jgi:ABC-type uncharacterized transport system substrate-binding protein